MEKKSQYLLQIKCTQKIQIVVGNTVANSYYGKTRCQRQLDQRRLILTIGILQGQKRFVKQFLQNEPLIEERLQIRKSQKNPQILVKVLKC